MYECETFCYLDVQKTGSTFIILVLKKFCKEMVVQRDKHVGLGAGFDKNKLYFISVRSPIDQYLSLYSYGCKGKGKLFNKMRNSGFSHLYDKSGRNFSSWLDFLLDYENAHLLGDEYGTAEHGDVAKLVGLQSYRVLQLAVPDSQNAFKAASTSDEMWTTFKSKNIVNHTIRNESLRADLSELFRTRLRNSISNIDEALTFIASARPRNASPRIDRAEDFPKLDMQLRRKVEEREWLLYRAFGY